MVMNAGFLTEISSSDAAKEKKKKQKRKKTALVFLCRKTEKEPCHRIAAVVRRFAFDKCAVQFLIRRRKRLSLLVLYSAMIRFSFGGRSFLFLLFCSNIISFDLQSL